jgi:hypothetical protein
MEAAMKPDEAMPQKGREKSRGDLPVADRADARHTEAQRQKPAAGPYAKPHLTDPEKTPGAGALPDPDHPRDPDATG